MRKAEVQMMLKKGSDDETHGVAPPSPQIPPKRARVNPDQVVPSQDDSLYPSPTPPVFIRKMRNAAVGTGCDIRLKVAVAGDPQPSLFWYHNDILLDTDNQEYGGLWIRDCQPSHAGLYTCIASNYLGEASSSSVLAVLDLGEDSETTEDEAAEPQIPMETKDGQGPQEQVAHRVPAGDGDRMTDIAPDTSGRRGSQTDSWMASQNTVVEKEVYALGSRAPGLQDVSKPARGQSEDVLREASPQVLPLPSPKISHRTSTSPLPNRSGSAPATPLTPRKKVIVPSEYQDTVPGEFEEKIKQPKSSAMSQSSNLDSRPQTPVSEYSRKDLTPRPSPKLTRASSKIIEKVRIFEERRRSIDQPEGSISGRSWAGFHRTPSIDSDDGGSRLGISRESSREDLREALKADAAQRRSNFRQRATSLEDRPRYSQKVQDIENKFTEELQRIKKLVGKPHMKKSFSTEQLSSKSRQPLRKLEPIPLQVIQKLQDRERIQQQQERKEREQREQSPEKVSQSPSKPQGQHLQNSQSEPLDAQWSDTIKKTITSVTVSRLEQEPVILEAIPLVELPGQSLAERTQRSSPKREKLQNYLPSETRSVTEEKPPSPALPKEESPPRRVELPIRKVDRRPVSPLVQNEYKHGSESSRIEEPPAPLLLKEESKPRRVELSVRRIEQRPASPLVQRVLPCVQERPSQVPSMLAARPSSPSPVSSPSSEDEKMDLELPIVTASPKLAIPAIIVEEEPMEDAPKSSDRKKRSSTAKDTKSRRGKMQRARPLSPEEDSSDDSYVSAGEDPQEIPMFEYPLQDTVASAGEEVQLNCIVVGTPIPQVTWKRENEEITSTPTHVVKVEGERHSLLIRRAKRGDAGTYHVTAVNAVGKASCNATLFIKPELMHERRGGLNVPMDISSPITSDEEYLSPLEEGMDFGGPYCQVEPRKIVDVRFREPPVFQVALTNQVVTEGQEVTMSVRIHGQPKPMIYWLRDRVTIKTGARHIVRETDSGTFEMKIISAQKSDAGVYTCKIINEYGTKQCDCKLEVKVPPMEPVLAITRNVSDVTVSAGETALFECHMTGPQDVDVDWLADGKLIQPALLNCKMHFDGRKCRLLLNSVHEDDSGTYTCKLSTAKEELTSTAKLKVMPSIEPLFTRKLDVLEVIEGRSARFDCKVSGTPPPQVSWSHFDRALENNENIRILKEGGRHMLVITHVSSEDEGFYTVVARNQHGTAECSADLYVQEPRTAISSQMAKLEKMPSIPEEPEVAESEVEQFTMPDFIKPLYDLDVVEGKEAVLKCRVAGLPYPSITWFHNGHKINSTDDRKMVQHRDIHSLVIRSVCHAHAGVYKSVISNKVGKAACYAHLYVTDILPDPPEGPPVIEAITGKTISLSWTKPKRLDPSLDASSLMYAVQQQALGSIQWTIIVSSLKQTSYTVASLSKGVRYFFRVLSMTNKVFSKPSPPTEPVQLVDRGPYLQEAPVITDKPDIVYVVENQSLSITITLNYVQATVTWKRGNTFIVNKPGIFETSMPDDNQHALRIIRVKSSDVGQIICTASNKFGSDSCILTLEMAAPPTFETIMEDMDVCVGETPRFAVVVEGKPVPDIMWYKNDTLLSESSHFTFVYDDNECSLVILNTQEEDSGVYTCTARNLAGSVTCKAELTVRTAKQEKEELMEDEETILRKMRRLTDYYDVHKEIGRGAFSYVKRVTKKGSKVEYAAKFISARAKRKVSALREMKILSQLDHERIVYFHDAFEKKNVVIIITDLCHEEFLERLAKKSTVTQSEIHSTVRQMLEGVSYLHQNNILHLDIKPENILMADHSGDRIRLCDFGNAMELTPDEPRYCKYGTPEFVAPEIVNQTPVSKATDIWPIGVITYLCLTGVSPFAGENDRSTVLNIRSYNVAFEESMFADLCREAKGFVIKLLVVDRLRPDVNECLRHPWFKTLAQEKSISTEAIKQFLSRRKWQRSLISYKSKMAMRSIPELLDDSSSHTSIAVPRHLREGSPPLTSSSDSDEDIDELPFIPMPLTMDFSGSRMSLNDILGDDDVASGSNGTTEGEGLTGQGTVPMETGPADKAKEGGETSILRGRLRKRATQEEDKGSSDEEPAVTTKRSEQSKRPLRRGSSMESEKTEGSSSGRKGCLRRGGSADSALLLHIKHGDGESEGATEDGKKKLKKAVSMELPRRSSSPGAGKLSKEDYALKLELMRQRLLRGVAVDNKMSGLRGPLLETLGAGEEKRTIPIERYVRPHRLGGAPMIRAASSDTAREDSPKIKVLRKSASFSQGDTEPIPLHRRSGAPLEIPMAQIEERRLQEAASMSALTEQVKMDSHPVTPMEVSSEPPATEQMETIQESDAGEQIETVEEKNEPEKEVFENGSKESNLEDHTSAPGRPEKEVSVSKEERRNSEMGSQNDLVSEVTPSSVIEESITEEEKNEEYVDELRTQKIAPDIVTSAITVKPLTVPAKPSPNVIPTYVTPPPLTRVTLPDGRTSAYASTIQTIMVPSLQPASVTTTTPVPITTATYTPTPPSPTPEPAPTSQHPAVFSRVASTDNVSREPSPPSIPVHPSSLTSDIKDIASEEVFESRFKKRDSSLTRGFKLLNWAKSEEKSATMPPESGEDIYRPGAVGTPIQVVKPEASRMMMEKSKSVQDLREASKDRGFMKRLSMRLKRTPPTERKEEKSREEAPATEPSAPRRRLSWALSRSKSQEKVAADVEMVRMDGAPEAPKEEVVMEPKKASESPILNMRRKIESTVAGISMRIRSQSEERKGQEERKEEKKAEEKSESKRTPLLSLLRRSSSEGISLKKLGLTQNPLASQSVSTASTESLESTSSIQSESAIKNPESDRRLRWDRWGLTRGRKDKTVSQPDIPSAIARDGSSFRGRQYTRLASDFPPVFHIKLKDHVLLEGDPVTLSCLPAGSPHPRITWMKDKKPLEIDARMNMISCPDGRQLLMIMKTSGKDAGLYECVASNPLASVTSSCILTLARLPEAPGTPEVPQKYKNTVLVLWKPSSTPAPCTYSLERKREGDENWLFVATGLADCYCSVTDLPTGGTYRFRVACVNKAGQGPYSNCSEPVCLDSAAPAAEMKTVPSTSVVTSSVTVPPIKPGSTVLPSKPATVATVKPSSPPQATPPVRVPSPSTAAAASTSTHALPAHSPNKSLSVVTPLPPPTHTVPSHRVTEEIQTPHSVTSTPPKAKTTLNISVTSSPAMPPKLAPPTVLPKPKSPPNIVPPASQTPPISPPPLVSPPPTIGKPIFSVPLYVPVTTAEVSPPTPTQSLSTPVVLVTSLSPVGEGMNTPSRMTPSGLTAPSGRLTPSGRRTPSGKAGESTLRQGVPQKPYTFMDEKARGRFGVIRECKENATGKLFMAKIVPYEPESKQDVLKEYDILKALHHEKIMTLHEAYVTPRYLVLISEYCAGKEMLYSLVDRFRYSEDDVVNYVAQILLGLDYLHGRRILHLDIKPDNVMVTYNNIIKIIDFGSAQNFNPLFLKPYSLGQGILEFMSPEMVKGDVVGPPADIWSVGVLTYIMLSGRLPFQEANPADTEAKIQAAKFDLSKLYQNVSQSASLFLKKILCSYPWARPTIKDCFNNSWLQDAYLMRLRRQTLTFTTTRLKEFLVEQQRRRSEVAIKHKVLLRSYQSTPGTPTTPSMPPTPVTQ
ncbi:striated muscle preferentially expressed protein kinase-like isoform X2 [Brienomyrus brachyistius]|uniref:striated muscle preferentially expressed protein kinase-like isoform X2 n=1 Tax=Brienomyrus brachyistius TaxID=42636 RepID=UPI0020B3C4B2|nr:striated muscle preferentially expressed protein kinase-like isoform X2 [Brienomyrus brachyistius]